MRKVKTLFLVILTGVVFLYEEIAFASGGDDGRPPPTPSTTPSVRPLDTERVPPPLTLPPTGNPTVPGTDDDAFSPGLGGPRGSITRREPDALPESRHGRCRVGRMGSDSEMNWYDD